MVMRNRSRSSIDHGPAATVPTRHALAISRVWLLAMLAIFAAVATLHLTAWWTSTIALSFFIALALWPVDAAIRRQMPFWLGWLGHLAALMLMLLVFMLFLGGVILAARQIMAGLPAYVDDAQVWLERLAGWLDMPRVFDRSEDALAARIIDPIVGFATTIMQSIGNLAATLSLIVFLVLLMLIETPLIAAKLRSVTGRSSGEAWRALVLAVAARVRRYLVIRTVLGILTGVLYMAWSWLWGLDFIIVWGLLAFLLNYIPTVGSLVAGILPAGLAFLQLGFWPAVAYGGGLLLIEQIMGNYVDPKMQGRELALSPLAVFISLIFWSWLWGLAGALVAVPMTLVVMFVSAQMPVLRPVALFLSDRLNARDLLAEIADNGKNGTSRPDQPTPG